MKTSPSVLVGLFISTGLVILIAAIFFLGGQQKKFTKSFTIKAIFSDVNGLQAGSNIWLLGVNVGTVKAVRFAEGNSVEIEMNVVQKAQSRIHKDATAKISSDGFIGNKIIVLTGGSEKAAEIEEGAYINAFAITGTDQIMATLQDNNKNLLAITENIKKVSLNLINGEGTIGQLLTDKTIAHDLQTAMSNFKHVSAKSELVIDNVQRFSAGLHKNGTLANAMVNDTLVYNGLLTTVTYLKTASENLDKAAFKVNTITDSLQNVTDALSNKDKPIGLLLNDAQVTQQLKRMIKNLESGSKKLDDDLEAAQHNFLLKGFFKRKNRIN